MRAGNYGYAHSCIESANFPARQSGSQTTRKIVLLQFEHEITTEEALAEAARLGLQRPMYEDALHFGIDYPEMQREGPIAFLHEPWYGFYGRRDVLCLWINSGRRELGVDDFDDAWTQNYRLAFFQP